MKHTEAILAVRHLAAYFPNQKFDEFTADAWADALTRYEYPDAMDVIKRVATAPLRQGQSFLLELRDITGGIDDLVAERVKQRVGLAVPPSNLGPVEYQAWLVEHHRAIAKRDWTPPPAIEGTHDASKAITAALDATNPKENS